VNVPGVERRVYVFTTQGAEHKPTGVSTFPSLLVLIAHRVNDLLCSNRL